MDPGQRQRFNADFTPAKYAQLLHCVNTTERWPADFRIGETPVFLTSEFTDELVGAANEILSLTRTPEFAGHAATAIPAGLEVPNETPHPTFVAIDFGICTDESGRLTPRLIELQGFPSLYGFQFHLLDCMRRAYPAIPADWTSSFQGLQDDDYLAILREGVVGSEPVENVILLELDPEKQNTRIDFANTDRLLGVRPVNVTSLRKEGRELFYDRHGRKTRVHRIYNRVIFDELQRRPDVKLPFSFQDELDVAWAGHPNWYFKISKHSLPYLKTKHTSPAYFADEFPASESISDYVLKPLYSFSGLGVDLKPTQNKLQELSKPGEWILQRKVDYAAFLPTPDGALSKAEIRMMFVWPDDGEPVLVNNLVRLSQGAMMGVKFNKDKTWVGSSIALHQRGEDRFISATISSEVVTGLI